MTKPFSMTFKRKMVQRLNGIVAKNRSLACCAIPRCGMTDRTTTLTFIAGMSCNLSVRPLSKRWRRRRNYYLNCLHDVDRTSLFF